MIVFKNIADTQLFSEHIATVILPPASIWLQGPLGVGKTFFCREFIRHFDASVKVKSPTYTLLQSYALDTMTIHHFDFYRIVNPEELAYLDIRECFGANNICLIEWPEKAEMILPFPQLRIKIEYGKEEQERKVSIESNDQALFKKVMQYAD